MESVIREKTFTNGEKIKRAGEMKRREKEEKLTMR